LRSFESHAGRNHKLNIKRVARGYESITRAVAKAGHSYERAVPLSGRGQARIYLLSGNGSCFGIQDPRRRPNGGDSRHRKGRRGWFAVHFFGLAFFAELHTGVAGRLGTTR